MCETVDLYGDYRQTSDKSHNLVGNKLAAHCRRCPNYVFVIDLKTWLQ